MDTYIDLTKSNAMGDTKGLEVIFSNEGVYVRYFAKGYHNRHAHKTYFFESRLESEIRQFIDNELTGSYDGVSCVDALLQNFDIWLSAKMNLDHLQLKYVKDSHFDELKAAAEQNQYEMTEEMSDTSYRTYFSKVG